MRSKKRNIHDYIHKRKKKSEPTTPCETPTPSEQDAAYQFTANDERFPIWCKVILIRYWEDLQDSFNIECTDGVDKADTYVEHVIKISELTGDQDDHEDYDHATINRPKAPLNNAGHVYDNDLQNEK